MIERQWYKLAGESEEAMKEILALSEAANGPLDQIKHKPLFEKVGYFHGSGRALEGGGACMLYPDVFATEDGFYLAAPLGISAADILGKRDNFSHFEPPDAEKLDEEQTEKLMNRLFHGGWGDAAPILGRTPLFSPIAQGRTPAGP